MVRGVQHNHRQEALVGIVVLDSLSTRASCSSTASLSWANPSRWWPSSSPSAGRPATNGSAATAPKARPVWRTQLAVGPFAEGAAPRTHRPHPRRPGRLPLRPPPAGPPHRPPRATISDVLGRLGMSRLDHDKLTGAPVRYVACLPDALLHQDHKKLTIEWCPSPTVYLGRVARLP